MHEGVQRALSSPLSTSYNGSASPPVRANSAGTHVAQYCSDGNCLPLLYFRVTNTTSPVQRPWDCNNWMQ